MEASKCSNHAATEIADGAKKEKGPKKFNY